jgi:dipeptidyl aminopeptidase/acylaminoacyl peptidase
MGGWLEGDSAILLYDRYDIWRMPADGSAPVRLTRGREAEVTYRVISVKDREEERHIGPAETLLLSLFDNKTKENGLASVQVSNPQKTFRTLTRGGYTWAEAQKARKANVYTYNKGNFQEPMDVYYTAALGKSEQKLSAINPQIKDYNWGTVELYHWTAYDGTALDGLLYKPEDFDANKKYPVMIYFYEKNSETLYRHIPVQPSWSIINITFYVSRGYVVFVPDIVYKSGLPGESAINCIVSGAESLTRYAWIDKDNMAIQGQSWGGYQVAYLITRTGMFKAAGAGAPVSNMTSAFGGIRWESGNSRQGQYEQGQSRIGRDLWEGWPLYVENSPLYRLPNVTTPVLIMHNDADGAVPWYQGIEMFMGLRRLGKPAWLLEYNDEAHNLRQRRNRKDLTIRLQQFFDYYLKGAPQPAWMKDGIPSAKKGYYFGYENAE